MIERLIDYECKAWCVEVDCKRQRSMLAKLRGGTAELKIETGRWRWSLVLFAYHFTWLSRLCRLLRLGSCVILKRGERLIDAIPSSDACILAWGRGWSVCFVSYSYDFLLVWSCQWQVFKLHAKASQRAAILSIYTQHKLAPWTKCMIDIDKPVVHHGNVGLAQVCPSIGLTHSTTNDSMR